MSSLTKMRESLLLAHFPAGTKVIAAQSYRPEYLPFPMRVHLREPNGNVRRCVVKSNQHDLIDKEIRALRILRPTGLPVPELLSDTIPVPCEDRALIVLSELPGTPLPWCGVTSLEEANQTCQLLLDAVNRLHRSTTYLYEENAGAIFPQITLDAEYSLIIAEAGEWSRVSLFQRAVESIGF